MTKKDYVMTARAIREQWVAEVEAAQLTGTLEGVLAIEALAFRIADAFEKDNGRFRRDTFLHAALGEPEAVVA